MSEVRNKKKKSKRKRNKQEQLAQEQAERYNKLVHMATKALHKEAKVVKSFECQKIVRKLKQQGSQKEEERLAFIKKFSLDHVTHTCLHRLGIHQLNPDQDTTTDTPTLSKEEEELVEKILAHKRMVSAMETWNQKVTDYRRWYLRRHEAVSDTPDFVKDDFNKRRLKTQDGPFVCLGGTTMEDMEDDNYYGPAAGYEDEYTAIVKKKNRPGQRARKAKAMAMEAKKKGQRWDSSVNWREKKKVPKKEDAKPEVSKASSSKPDIATMGKTWKEEGKEHPSWAGARKQKSGIVAFAGKKITFDDDD